MLELDLSTLPDLVARDYAGPSDHDGIARVINRGNEASGVEEVATVEGLDANYRNLTNCDPASDMVIVDGPDGLVAYGRTLWWQVVDGPRTYAVFARMDPTYRGTGLYRTMFEAIERRAIQIADSHDIEGPKVLETWAATPEQEAHEAALASGYSAETYGALMVRPDLDDIPDRALPDGVEIRPADQSHLRQIWDAEVEAFRDHWGFSEPEEADYRRFVDFEYQDLDLWTIAWAADDVVGQVRSFINPDENRTYARKRGYTEWISTARQWRKQGIASALISESLRRLRDRGMEEAALGVHTENLSGAMSLYTGLGFVETMRWTTYHKAL